MNTDHKLKTDVLAESAWEPSISADHIGVTATFSDDIQHALQRSWFFDEDNIHVSAEGGKVHLTGTVDSWVDRQTAASTAWAAPATTSVENDVRVSDRRGDKITQDAVERIRIA